ATVFAVAFFKKPELNHDGLRQRRIQLFPTTAPQVAGQYDFAEARTNQTTYRNARRFKHTAHSTIAPFVQRDSVPAIAAFATQVLQRAAARRTVVEFDAFHQAPLLFLIQLSEHAHRVLALGAVAGLHQPVGERP